MSQRAAVAVIGCGFYGARVALMLAALRIGRVIVLEREPGLMRRASFVNQARVHNGYHYPRAARTGASARRNSRRFIEEYRAAIRRDVPMIYAIARQSLISPEQFVRFCAEIGAFCHPAAPEHARLFDGTHVEAVFAVEEFSLDAALVAHEMAARLNRAGVECRFGAPARVSGLVPDGVQLQAGAETIIARHVVNCTYADLDGIGVRVGAEIRKEVAEIAMIRPPPALASLAVTVMDGPFFSTMPFPPLGCHSLTHVRHTPHCAFAGPGEAPPPGPSRSALMLRDAARFLPAIEKAETLRSLYEIKAVLQATEDNDARPILLEASPDSPRILSVLGSKLDNVYDVEALLAARAWD
ncbi:FAD-dependent oxidoreductase [Roseococcus microcysteis]|uniref:FAD-dependent oxidoreductase n=1 Tax=Roseococcus microcysteis TaxID=2771361 RepID=UPI00168A71FE|nr:FAD-dependent oxidoreductase [Roseococcus microcysteis]